MYQCNEEQKELEEVKSALKEMGLEVEEGTEDDFMSKRRIWINDEITAEYVEGIIELLIKINEEDTLNGLPYEERIPIKLLINTPGGCLFSAMTLIDFIQNSETPIYTVTLSFGYSAGFIIGLAGHKRFCYKYSNFLMHSGHINLSNHVDKFKDTYKYIERKQEVVKKFILENTKFTKKGLNKVYDSEFYIDSEQALKLGVVDEILNYIMF